jgi:hypothetical protein
LEWTTQLGDAYLTQPDDVMDAIQELRAQAQTVGNLVDTPQQRVVEDDSYIRIVPADPEYIFVPYYDPEVVYYERPVDVPLLTFSVGCEAGPWLRYDFDWHHRRLYCGDWHQGWDYRRDHDRDGRRGDEVCINRQLTNTRVWHGDPGRRLASAHIFAQTRVARERDRSIALPEHFAERSHHRDSMSRAITADNNGSRSPSSTRTLPDMNRGDHNSRSRFVMPQTAAPSVAGSGKHDDDHFRGDPRSRSHADDNKGDVPRALPFHGDGNDRISPGRMPHAPTIAGNGTRDDDKVRGDVRSHSQDDRVPDVRGALPIHPGGNDHISSGRMMHTPSTLTDGRSIDHDRSASDAARIAAAATRARAEMNQPHDNPVGPNRRDLTPHVVPNPQQVSPIHRDVPRSPAGPSVNHIATPPIAGRVDHSGPQRRVAPEVPQHIAPQMPQPQVAARIQHSPPQARVAPQPQVAAHIQHSPPPQARVAPQVQHVAPQPSMAARVQHSAPAQPRITPQVQHSAPAAQAATPQGRSGSSHGSGSSSNDDSHKRRH